MPRIGSIALGATLGAALMAHVAVAQHQHPPAHGAAADAPHHLFAQQCATAFERTVGDGRGFGLAFVADQQGYPGPLHVLELKDRLKLTSDQAAKVQALLGAMYAESGPKSAELLDAEGRLRALFVGGTADEASVSRAVIEVERRRAEVRMVHLRFHLKTRDLLTGEQRRVYHEARWSGQP